METVLVVCSRRSNQIQINIGVAVMMNSLKLSGIPRRLIDLIPIDPEDRLDHFRKNLSREPAIYGFGLTIGNGQVVQAEECARIVKEANPENIVVYGGPLASASPKVLAARSRCDFVLAGEAENTFPELVRQLASGELHPDVNKIRGLYYKQDGEVKGVTFAKLGALGETSNPDYREFDTDFYIGYLKETGQSWEIMASRGCQATCTFCYKITGSLFSVRPVESVLDEIEMVITNYDLRRFYFVDDNLMELEDWYREFLKRKQERGLDFSFVIQTRIDAITEELVKEGAKNGLVCISTGIEVASQKSMDMIKKKLTIDQVKAALALANSCGIGVTGNFILGFDWETETDWQALHDFIRDNGLSERAKLSYLTPLPNTLIYRQAKERGLIGDEWEYILKMGDLYFELVVNMTNLPDERLKFWYEKIQGLAHRRMVFPTSERYLTKLADHYYQRVGDKRLTLSAAPSAT